MDTAAACIAAGDAAVAWASRRAYLRMADAAGAGEGRISWLEDHLWDVEGQIDHTGE